MEHTHKISSFVFAISSLFLVFLSCTKEPLSNLNSRYKTESLTIKKDGFINKLDTNEYEIKVEASLSLPDKSTILSCSRLKYDDGHFFLQSEGKNQTIWVFDSIGHFVTKLGERGRSRNEYQTDITDWFYINSTDEVVVFEKNSKKIHVFALDGSKPESFILQSWPNAIGVLDRGRIFCSYYQREAKEGMQLALLSENEDVVSPFIFLGHDMEFVPSDKSFYKIKEQLFHIPCFADSAIIFRSDTVEKIVKLKFEDDFITEELKEKAYKDNLENYNNFNGIKYVSEYYETSEYNIIRFLFEQVYINQIINKKNDKQYRFISALPRGIFPSNVFCVRDDKIYYLITKENVEEIRILLEKEALEKQMKISSSIIKDIFNDKIQLPAIVSIKIK